MPDGSQPRIINAPRDSDLGAGAPGAERAQPCLGRIVALDGDGRPRVVFAGLEGRPPVARSIGVVLPEQLEAARREARVILLGFLDGRADAPVIMSLASMGDLDVPAATEETDATEETEDTEDTEAIEPELPTGALELEVDGDTQVIEARDKLVLRCGDAAIELEADGTVRIIGRDITSWARRRQRIRGGSVAIN